MTISTAITAYNEHEALVASNRELRGKLTASTKERDDWKKKFEGELKKVTPSSKERPQSSNRSSEIKRLAAEISELGGQRAPSTAMSYLQTSPLLLQSLKQTLATRGLLRLEVFIIRDDPNRQAAEEFFIAIHPALPIEEEWSDHRISVEQWAEWSSSPPNGIVILARRKDSTVANLEDAFRTVGIIPTVDLHPKAGYKYGEPGLLLGRSQ